MIIDSSATPDSPRSIGASEPKVIDKLTVLTLGSRDYNNYNKVVQYNNKIVRITIHYIDRIIIELLCKYDWFTNTTIHGYYLPPNTAISGGLLFHDETVAYFHSELALCKKYIKSIKSNRVNVNTLLNNLLKKHGIN